MKTHTQAIQRVKTYSMFIPSRQTTVNVTTSSKQAARMFVAEQYNVKNPDSLICIGINLSLTQH